MFGILNLNKPPGWTSRDAVNRVQSLVGRTKAGHAGTLDPLATGVLVVCVGPATRLIRYVQQMQKTYRATFLLGRQSVSDDTETPVVPADQAPLVDRSAFEAALPSFVGEISQRPPAYSAKKVDGQRAYAIARAGQEVSLPASRVRVDTLSILEYDYPKLQLEIVCGSGFYVRSLGRDLAAAVGTTAVMSALQRTAVGCYRAEEATPADQLDRSTLSERLLPPLTALEAMDRLHLTAAQLDHLRHGRTVDDVPGPPGDYAAVDAAGRLAALVHRDHASVVQATRNFPEPE